MKFVIQLDQSAAKELLDAFGTEFFPHKYERVHRLMELAQGLVDGSVADRNRRFGQRVRLNTRNAISRSIRLVRLPDRSKPGVRQDASETTKNTRSAARPKEVVPARGSRAKPRSNRRG